MVVMLVWSSWTWGEALGVRGLEGGVAEVVGFAAGALALRA